MSDQIPTLLQPKRIELANGRAVKIRRAKRAQRERLIAAGAIFGDGTSGGAIMTRQYAVRWGVIAIEGFKQPSTDLTDSGQVKPDVVLEFKANTHPTLGQLLSEDLYDVLTEDDINAIAVDVVPELAENQAGN